MARTFQAPARRYSSQAMTARSSLSPSMVNVPSSTPVASTRRATGAGPDPNVVVRSSGLITAMTRATSAGTADRSISTRCAPPAPPVSHVSPGAAGWL